MWSMDCYYEEEVLCESVIAFTSFMWHFNSWYYYGQFCKRVPLIIHNDKGNLVTNLGSARMFPSFDPLDCRFLGYSHNIAFKKHSIVCVSICVSVCYQLEIIMFESLLKLNMDIFFNKDSNFDSLLCKGLIPSTRFNLLSSCWPYKRCMILQVTLVWGCGSFMHCLLCCCRISVSFIHRVKLLPCWMLCYEVGNVLFVIKFWLNYWFSLFFNLIKKIKYFNLV